MTDELQHHWQLHVLDEESARHEATLAKHPELRRQSEARALAARKALAANEQKAADAQKRRRELEREIAAFDEQERRFQKQLDSVTDQKQFEAVQHEIANVRAKRSDIETTALECLETEERLAAERPALAHALERADADQAALASQLGAEADALHAALGALTARRERVVAKLEPAARLRYERIRGSLGGRPVAAILKGACGGCFRGQPPHALQEARKRDHLLTCDGCGRLLLLPPEGDEAA